jgi:hypothetical protein
VAAGHERVGDEQALEGAAATRAPRRQHGLLVVDVAA